MIHIDLSTLASSLPEYEATPRPSSIRDSLPAGIGSFEAEEYEALILQEILQS